MRTIEELQKELHINRIALDEELIQQPQLYWEASEGYTIAASNRDTAKLSLDRAEADCALHIRGQQLEKLSDKKVADAVLADPTYIGYYESYLQYKALTERLAALRDAFQQRSSMLRDLVVLTNIGYWGSGLPDWTESYKEKYKARQEANKTKVD
jgi:hypothetical protein